MADATSHPDAIRVWFRFVRLSARIRTAMSDRLAAIGLSVPQCDVLSTLTEAEGVTQQQLAERLYVTKGNISGLIDRLAAAGLVERRAIPGDRRSHAIYLTAEGRAIAEQGIALQQAFVGETFGMLPPADLNAMEEGLLATRDHVRAVTEARSAHDKTAGKGSGKAGRAGRRAQ